MRCMCAGVCVLCVVWCWVVRCVCLASVRCVATCVLCMCCGVVVGGVVRVCMVCVVLVGSWCHFSCHNDYVFTQHSHVACSPMVLGMHTNMNKMLGTHEGRCEARTPAGPSILEAPSLPNPFLYYVISE